MSDTVPIAELEWQKAPWGEVTLVGLGRLGLRTGLTLMQAHRGGPKRIVAIDGQIISPDDLIFRTMGAEVGDYKTKFFQKLAPQGFSKEIIGITSYLSDDNLDHYIVGDVVCIEVAGGDTLASHGQDHQARPKDWSNHYQYPRGFWGGGCRSQNFRYQ